MGEVQEIQLQVRGDQEAKDPNGNGDAEVNDVAVISRKSKLKRWIRIALYAVFVLAGQSVSALLTRLYFEKGGHSNWLVTSLQFIGFPILIPFYFLSPKTPAPAFSDPPPSALKLALVYVPLGLLYAGDGLLFSLGLLYLPLSTYALLISTQLAFNAVFSFFLNAQKFTSFIINSLVLLTISSVLLVFETESESSGNQNTKSKYAIGFICTLGGSAGAGLLLSLTQYAFTKVIKQETFKAVMDMIVYTSLVASGAIVVGVLVSGDANHVEKEKEEFQLGKVSYAMILLWTTVFWQVYSIGSVGLISEVSSLFSNAISILGVPLAPVMATIFFHEKMTGVKAISMVLAIWGLSSYVYQQYLDDHSSEEPAENAGGSSEASLGERLVNSYN